MHYEIWNFYSKTTRCLCVLFFTITIYLSKYLRQSLALQVPYQKMFTEGIVIHVRLWLVRDWMLMKVKLKVWVHHLNYLMNIMCDMTSLKLWMQLIKVDLPHGVRFVYSVYHTANACIHGISLFSLSHSQIWWWVEASLRLHR